MMLTDSVANMMIHVYGLGLKVVGIGLIGWGF